MKTCVCILASLATAVVSLSETSFLSRSVHSPAAYPTAVKSFESNIRHNEYSNDSSMIWDFSNIIFEKASTIHSAPQNDSSILVINKFGCISYSLIDNGYGKSKFSNNSQQTIFAKPEKVLEFPFIVGDSIHSSFYAEGCLNNSDFLRIAGLSVTRALDYGSLILPNNDTLKNIVHLHSVRTGGILIDSQQLHGSCQQPRDLSDSEILHLVKSDSITFVDEHWLWMSANHPLPIVELQTARIFNHDIEVDVKHSATVIPATEQPMRYPTKEETEEAETLMLSSGKRRKSAATQKSQATGLLPSVEFVINPKITDGNFSIACSDLPSKVRVLITNTAGKIVRLYNDAYFPLHCNVSGQADGVYLVTIYCGSNIIFSDSIIKK